MEVRRYNAMKIIEDKRYGISEVFSMIGEKYLLRNDDHGQKHTDIDVDGFLVHPISLRYMNFYQHGTTCVCCGKQGTHFRLCGDPDTSRRHFNLYADDGTLITKDHIVPRSKGGPDCVENMQTMCITCNKEKGNKSEITIPYIVAVKKDEGKELVFRDIRKAARHIALSYIKPSKKNQENTINAAISAVLHIQQAIETHTEYAGFVWEVEER